jgi:predicted XRE-type DNA-binding protein
MTMTKNTDVEESSGNVFADLGYPNPQEALAKARLAQRIAELIEEQNLTQVQAAVLLGIDQPNFQTDPRSAQGIFHQSTVSIPQRTRSGY